MTAMRNTPDFILIGAMKCATTTLHDQLAKHPGLFLTTPKEPNYFSDDDVFSKGPNWYSDLFKGAAPGDICGESSTHYTKQPLHPLACQRMHEAVPKAKLIYMMKHPLERLVSHYMHEWSQRNISIPLEKAIDKYPEMIAYSCYHQQLTPYIERFGQSAILPIFVPFFENHAEDALRSVAKHIGYTGVVRWHTEVSRSNTSADRLRLTPAMSWMVSNPVLRALRRNLVPRTVRDSIKGRLQMRSRPELSDKTRLQLETVFDRDLKALGEALGIDLNCRNFNVVTASNLLSWADR